MQVQSMHPVLNLGSDSFVRNRMWQREFAVTSEAVWKQRTVSALLGHLYGNLDPEVQRVDAGGK